MPLTYNNPSKVLFLGKCWCEPGWLTPECKKPVLTNGDCECYPNQPDDRSFLKNVSWVHPKGYRYLLHMGMGMG